MRNCWDGVCTLQLAGAPTRLFGWDAAGRLPWLVFCRSPLRAHPSEFSVAPLFRVFCRFPLRDHSLVPRTTTPPRRSPIARLPELVGRPDGRPLGCDGWLGRLLAALAARLLGSKTRKKNSNSHAPHLSRANRPAVG